AKRRKIGDLGKAAFVDNQRENSLGQAEGILNRHFGNPEPAEFAIRLRMLTVNLETLEKRELEMMPVGRLRWKLGRGIGAGAQCGVATLV
ncbi:MAG TPA: hypothetical protein VF278_06365, partial [Pirellulales bacterium]